VSIASVKGSTQPVSDLGGRKNEAVTANPAAAHIVRWNVRTSMSGAFGKEAMCPLFDSVDVVAFTGNAAPQSISITALKGSCGWPLELDDALYWSWWSSEAQLRWWDFFNAKG
jgi:hypothetical protein